MKDESQDHSALASGEFPPEAPAYDWEALRAKLAAATGRRYWRSLEELADSEGFRAFLEAEFPRQASVLDALGRRQFLQLMGASLGLAGLSACTKQPVEKIYPYVKAPEEVVPGQPLYFATALPLSGFGRGVLVESHMGRPTKIEGNPDHPASLGATDIFAQADILTLYDPDRSQAVRFGGVIRPWQAFVDAAQREFERLNGKRGAGFRILTETVTSPSLLAEIHRLLAAWPEARWHHFEPVNRDHAHAGAKAAFGEVVDAVYNVEAADVVLCVEADLLGPHPGGVRYAREFARRRKVDDGNDRQMNRLYVVESAPSITGSVADHRLALRPSECEAFLRALAGALGLPVQTPASMEPRRAFIVALAKDLARSRGKSLVVVGEALGPTAHALAYAINESLGNIGETVSFVEPIAPHPELQLESLQSLVADMDAGKVEVLVILGGNPVYTAPADLKFGERLQKVGLRIRLGLYEDETSLFCHWHIPEAHVLESWGDIRAHDGTVTLIQPLIAPLYDGKTAFEVLAAFSSKPSRKPYDAVREYWKGVWSGADFEAQWRRALHDGVVPGSGAAVRPVTLRSDFFQNLRPPVAAPAGLEIVLRPDPTVYDGRYANNGWLQELPKPLTKLTWDNVAYVAPATAARLGLKNGDVVEVVAEDRRVDAPVWIQPGQAHDTVLLHWGYGRPRAGRVGGGIGVDAFRLCSSRAPWGMAGGEIRKTGRRYRLACTQDHFSLEGRDILRKGTLEEYRHDPSLAPHGHGGHKGELPSMYPGFPYTGYAWAMSIDLNACIGCGACTIACVAENNIAVVGKDQVARGREMHWIRVDRYYEGDLDAPEFVHQPIPCQQCENAPCELVCPVNATVHSAEGLNDMVYNRCVGTKYCANNCPYKVRRFNFYLYQDWYTESLKLLRNPDVTVRSRGVMEKCTYCVQRINAARIQAKREGRSIRDGEILTACQQVCPTEAIVFGDMNDAESRVAKLRQLPRTYQLLEELNTRPRTTYLAAVRNPNPELSSGKGHA
ncbi:MAG: TAT-variant-translocated molybdopterin oxidoreductase [Candidatus Binatia bacterium]|nr:TAT-variant-translocated molybdopterin oxidoreductase [Candidatus Binatia bacterium]